MKQNNAKTSFSLGNEALRKENYTIALGHYEKAIDGCPELAELIKTNLSLKRKKLDQFPIQNVEQKAIKISQTTFNKQYYLSNNPDVKEAGVDPEWHYFANGEREGRKPNAYFDPVFYGKINADVRSHNISPFQHFRDFGFEEGRLGFSPLEIDGRFSSERSKSILFVGHDGIQAGSEIVLLEVIKWFSQNTTRKIKVLLLAPGPVAQLYAKYAETYVLPEHKVDDKSALSEFTNENFEFIYLNTVVSGRLFALLNEHDINIKGDIIAHIHEMEKVLSIFNKEMEQLIPRTKLWISASPLSTETLINKYHIPTGSVVTIPAFIKPVATESENQDISRRSARNNLGLSPSAFIVSGCGTVYWRKGPDIFIEAARHFKKSSNVECEFIWFGNGPDKDSLTEGLSSEERKYIKFLGCKPNANELLASADAFFLSSREDPFPLVVLESAQHAIPTVCFKPATGITAFIESDAGIILDSIDHTAAANALLTLSQNREKLKALGTKAKQKLFRLYTSEKQNIKIFNSIRQHTNYKPSVSVIIPFYNHEKFITKRIESILAQKIKDIEIIALDDCSTDNSIKEVEKYKNDPRLRIIKNEKNSGSPFKQWERGIEASNSEIIWIAEGDDFCDNNFLSTLIPYFDDPLVNIVAAKTEIADENGSIKKDALKPYLDGAFPCKFDSNYIKDGFQEINEQLGAVCTLVNASGILIRKSSIGNIISSAKNYKMAGDWLVYLNCLKEGKIAYSTQTKNYFRRHSASQVHKLEGTEIYFNERKKISEFVFENFPVSRRLIKKSFDAMEHEWERFKHKHPNERKLDDLYPKADLLQKAKILKNLSHVAFYVHGMLFSKGGIERLAAQLANHLVRNGWKITIYCRHSKTNKPIYPLYSSINIVPIFDEHRIPSSITELRHHLINSEVDIFVPMLSEWLFDPIVEAAQNTGITVIASEHNDPWKIEELWWSREKRKNCFRKVDAIHLLLNKFTDSLPKDLHEKVCVIPNGVNIPENTRTNLRENLILSVGRLEPQKRFDRLIEAAAMIQKELRASNYRIEIYGEGSLRADLLKQIDEQGVNDLIFLMGKTSEIESTYQRASLFVLPSEFEGFGIVLVEALSYGLPAIAFNECNGPNEIIREGLDGHLVKSPHDLSEKIKELTNDNNLEHYRRRASERAKSFAINLFFAKWENLLETYK